MLSLASSSITFPLGAYNDHGVVVQLRPAAPSLVVGHLSEDNVLAVAPCGLLHTERLTTHAAKLHTKTVVAVARTEQEVLHLRTLTTNPLHFTLIS